jgi:TrmH family RNA methyltransferase
MQLATLSPRHHEVQRLRRLVGRRSAREDERAFVVEGAKVLTEAIAAKAPVEAVYVAPQGRDLPVVAEAAAAGIPVHELAPGALERVAGTVTPQPVLAVVRTIDVPLRQVRGASFVVVCVDVRDPGNLGTILRSAEAAGAGGLVCCDGSVDVYNPKTVRASAGSLFHVPVVAGGSAVEILDDMAGWGVQRIATVAHGGTALDDVDLRAPVAVVLGNEAHGLPAGLDGHVDEGVTIPIAGRSESLNVGMAAAVLCFEVARQRRLGRG